MPKDVGALFQNSSAFQRWYHLQRKQAREVLQALAVQSSDASPGLLGVSVQSYRTFRNLRGQDVNYSAVLELAESSYMKQGHQKTLQILAENLSQRVLATAQAAYRPHHSIP